MCTKARFQEYTKACSDPYDYLEKNFDLPRQASREEVISVFGRFATVTGSTALYEAADAFMQGGDLPDFVLQAASGAVVERQYA